MWRRRLAGVFLLRYDTKIAGGTPAPQNLPLIRVSILAVIIGQWTQKSATPDKAVVSVLARALECDLRSPADFAAR
jgi:hypothetical protein